MTQGVATMTLEDRDRDRVSKLVRQARAGDKSAFGELVERNWLDLVAIARGVLASGQGAEDVVQEALVHAWKRLWMLRTPASFDAWVDKHVAAGSSKVRGCLRGRRCVVVRVGVRVLRVCTFVHTRLVGR